MAGSKPEDAHRLFAEAFNASDLGLEQLSLA